MEFAMSDLVNKYNKLLSTLLCTCALCCFSLLGYQLSYAERVLAGVEKCYLESTETCSSIEINRIRVNHIMWNNNAKYYGFASAVFFTLYGGLLFHRESKGTKQ